MINHIFHFCQVADITLYTEKFSVPTDYRINDKYLVFVLYNTDLNLKKNQYIRYK